MFLIYKYFTILINKMLLNLRFLIALSTTFNPHLDILEVFLVGFMRLLKTKNKKKQKKNC